jgi:hypothetical protein
VKWLRRIELTHTPTPGYWSERGWTLLAPIRTTARVEIVRTEAGETLVAGTALAGLRGISAVEVRYRGATETSPWMPATLHQPPLGPAAWVQWRAHLPLVLPAGAIVEARAWDGAGTPQEEMANASFPDGASGIHQQVVS